MSQMDPECIKLCDAVNRIPGIRTIDSCCGHGEYSFRIFFIASSLKALSPLVYWFSQCHCGQSGWQIIARTDCSMMPVNFMIEGPILALGENPADEIASHINGFADEVVNENGKYKPDFVTDRGWEDEHV